MTNRAITGSETVILQNDIILPRVTSVYCDVIKGENIIFMNILQT